MSNSIQVVIYAYLEGRLPLAPNELGQLITTEVETFDEASKLAHSLQDFLDNGELSPTSSTKLAANYFRTAIGLLYRPVYYHVGVRYRP